MLLFHRDKSVILPRERQVILELSHVILDHTHHGMWVFPTAMTAALLLQHSSGLERSEESLAHHFYIDDVSFLSSTILRGLGKYVRVVEGTGATERFQGSLGGR